MKKSIDVANTMVEDRASSRILLLQRSHLLNHPYIWGLPGGLVDEGEDTIHAGLRELQEETGIGESSVALVGITRFLIEAPTEDIRLATVHVQLQTPNPNIVLRTDEHIAHGWFLPEKVYRATRMLPGSPTIIAATLGYPTPFTDHTMPPDIRVTQLSA